MQRNAIFLLFTMALMGFVRADYTGTVSEVKQFSTGGAAVDMDGLYPNQKMTLYVASKDIAAVGSLPKAGDKVTATGPVTQYKGKPEIKIHSQSQWIW